jgi:deoxyhypusine synthase
MSTIAEFISHHYRHFNAASLKDAAQGYKAHVEAGGKMLVTLAGAMSTAELGLSLSEMIRQDQVHGICCTGANLEDDVFNLVAHHHYQRIPNWRELSPQEEQNLLDNHLNRVTDTCIPEGEAMRRIEKAVLEEWVEADREDRSMFPHEFFFTILRDDRLKKYYQIDPKDS